MAIVSWMRLGDLKQTQDGRCQGGRYNISPLIMHGLASLQSREDRSTQPRNAFSLFRHFAVSGYVRLPSQFRSDMSVGRLTSAGNSEIL